MKLGIAVFGVASVAAGILDLIWGELEPAHQPLQAWGHVPGITIIGYIAGVWLVVAGAAILLPRTARAGAAALAILYGLFILFPLPRFYTAPHYLGYGIAVYIGVLGSVCEQIILAVAAFIAWDALFPPSALSSKAALIARWTFGLCSIDFGLSHLIAVQMAVPDVPRWMPLGATFWVVLTGIAFVLAGLGIVSGILDALAAQLLGSMLLVFSALSLTPMIFASPRDHVMWGGNAYNLTAVGAAWIVADWLATRRQDLAMPQSHA
jgi:uncharacterized membrane protein